MSELTLQRDLVKAVNDSGGHAFKASNRFLKGVADLYVKLPGSPGAWFECKKNVRPLKKTTIILAVTKLQGIFLQHEINAGGIGGIVSFITAPNKLWMAAYSFDELTNDEVQINDHQLVTNRHKDMVFVLERMMEGRRYA